MKIIDCTFEFTKLRNSIKILKMEKFISSFMQSISCCNLETGDFPGPVLTISRQSGCSAQRIAIKLSKILTGYSYMSDTKTEANWKWVDKSMFEEVVNNMIEEVRRGQYDDKEPSINMLSQVAQAFSNETIYDISGDKLIDTFKGVICRLACQGRMIVVGRSAGVILRNLPNKLNIRLEAPLEWRTNRIMQLKEFSKSEAVKYVREMDEKRDTFIEKIIGRKAENNDFDIIFNYSSLQDDEIIEAIVNILKSKKIISNFE